MAFTRIAARNELPAQDEAREFTCEEKIICVANVGGTITAVDKVYPLRIEGEDVLVDLA